MPVTAKGRSFPVEMTAVAWMDLLGYGSMLSESHFDPTHPNSIRAISRLERFQSEVANLANSYFKALIVNDGVAFVRQLSPRTVSVTYDFLSRSFDAFNAINRIEAESGYPGARMIVAAGPRMRIEGTTRYSESHLESLIKRLESGTIPPKQAMREAFSAMHVTGSVPELQANFALTRAYLADQAGTAGGFEGAKFFVDRVIFDDELPPWVLHDGLVRMTSHGINAEFLKLRDLDLAMGGRMKQLGIRAADDIATALSIDYM